MERPLSPVYWALRLCFGLVPLIAGLDKFTNLLVHWQKYLAPSLAALVPLRPEAFMWLVGIVEIVAGIGVLLTPWTRLFAWIVAVWLWCVALNLVAGGFYDIAVRDTVMGIASACLARVSVLFPAPARERERAEVREAHAT